MKKFVRGRYSRAISSMLMALLLLPCLTLPIGSVSQAATGGRQNIVLLPLTTSVGNAPNNLGGRIFQELQISLASQMGIQAAELTPTSPIFIRAKESMEDADRSNLVDQYNKSIDPATDHATRIKAAGYLAQTLGVDAVFYGTIDQYEFTTDPDPKQTFIHLTATKVMTGKSSDPIASPIIVVGRSRARVNDKNSQAFHDQEAIYSIAHNLADQLTGRSVSTTTKETVGGKASGGKGNNTALWALIGAALVAVAVGGSHSSSGSSGAVTSIAAPVAPSALLVADATTQVQGITIKTGYPQLTWAPSPSTNVTQYQIWRDDARSRLQRYEESLTGQSKIPVSHGKSGRATQGRLLSNNSRTPLSRTAQKIDFVSSSAGTTYVDHNVVNGSAYIYYVVAVATSGTQSATSTPSNEYPYTVDLQYPAKIAQGSLAGALDQNTPVNVDLNWTAPSANADGSSLALPGSFCIYRSTTVAPQTSTLSYTTILGSTFSPVTTMSWTTANGQYSYTDTSAPGNSLVTYAIVSLNKDGHLAPDLDYPVVQINSPLHQGIIVKTDQTSLVVTDPSSGAALDNTGTKPSTTNVTATVYQNGQPTPNLTVAFTSNDTTGSFPYGNTANTDSNGNAVVIYRGGQKTGNPVAITAISGTMSGTTTTPITMLPGSPAAITNTLSVLNSTTGIGTITVADNNTNTVPLAQVTLSTDNFTLEKTLVTTDVNGTATYHIYTNGAVGDANVTASIPGVSSAHATIHFAAQPNPQVTSGNLSVAMSSATKYSMILKDHLWQPLLNTSVTARVSNDTTPSNSPGTLSATGVTPAQQIILKTDASGQVAFTYNSPNLLGNITLTFFDSTFTEIGTPITIAVVVLGPTSLTVTAKSSSEIDLTWPSVTNAISYDIQQSLDGSTWNQIANVVTTTYQDGTSGTPLLAGTTYYYQVRAETNSGPSQWNPAPVSAPAVNTITFPAAPVYHQPIAVSGTEIDLSWDTVPSATTYQIFWKLSTDLTFPVAPQATVPVSNSQQSQTLIYKVMNLTPSTAYNFMISAVNASGATPSAVIPAQTLNVVPAASFAITTDIPRIYYSMDPKDLVSSKVPVRATVTIVGTSAKGVAAAGADIDLTTDKGYFDVSPGFGEALLSSNKEITGKLDSNGTMTFYFEGKPNSGNGGSITLPTLQDLGSPLFSMKSGGVQFTFTSGTLPKNSSLPLLIGPPHSIALTVTNPAAPKNSLFTLGTVWGYQNQNLSAQAIVKDLNNQPVLANMPVWIGQAWKQYQATATPPFDYAGTLGHATFGNFNSVTDDTGTVSNIPIGSSHSGKYTMMCFALKPNVDTTQMDQNANLSDAGSSANVLQYALTTDSSLTLPVTCTQDIWFDTYVDSLHGWRPALGSTTIQGVPSRINCNSADPSDIVYTGYDPDGKPVLPGTPYNVTGQLLMPASMVYSIDTAYLTDDGQNPVTNATTLYFNNQSQSDVIVRGKGKIGQVQLTFNNNLGQQTIFNDVADIFGYDPIDPSSVDLSTSYMTAAAASPISGSDQMNNVAAHKQVQLVMNINTQGQQPYPDGYIVTLLDGGNPVVTNGALQQAELIGGKVTFQYSYPLNSNAFYNSNLSVNIIGEAAAQHVSENHALSVATPTGGSILVERPYTATITPKNQIIHLAVNDSFSPTAVIKDFFGNPVFDGYDIKFRLMALNNSVLPNGVIPDSITDAAGNVSASFKTGVIPSWYKLEIYCMDINQNSFVLQDSGEIHVGLLDPSIALDVNPVTAVSIPVVITDPNPAGEVQSYDVEYMAAGAAVWTQVPVPPSVGSSTTSFVITGLQTKTNYQIRVRATTPNTDINSANPIVFSNYGVNTLQVMTQ